MKRVLWWVVVSSCWAGVAVAEEAFSKTVRAEDFARAGLAKLSAEELARLDALVREFKSGALEATRREAAVAETARAAAESRAARAEAQMRSNETAAKSSGGGLLARAKVILAPGTEVEYSTVESRLVGTYSGWDGRRTIFTLENGQRWQVADNNASYVDDPRPNPAVKIAPGALGSFWLTVEGVRARVKVVLLNDPK